MVYDQLETYFDESILLYDSSLVYVQNILQIHLTDFIKFQMDNGNAVCMVLLDLQKAFNAVDISFYLQNLNPLALVMTLLDGSSHICLVVNNLLMLPELFLHVQILHGVFLKGQYLDLCCF